MAFKLIEAAQGSWRTGVLSTPPTSLPSSALGHDSKPAKPIERPDELQPTAA
jgi:hypothetical protein